MISQLKNTKGFTLIELMIVVAIVGILAAVGLPAYQDYTIRAQVTEGLTLADGLKAPVTEYFQNTGAWPANNAAANAAVANTIKGKYVTQVAIVSNAITATFGGDANTNLANSTITLTATDNGGSISWACTSTADTKYLPKSCQP